MSTKQQAPEPANSEDLKLSTMKIWNVPFENLHIVKNQNWRTDYGDIDELAESIKANGVQEPLRGYRQGEDFFISNGHRRFKALTLIHSKGALNPEWQYKGKVKFILESQGTTEAERIVQMMVSNEGKPFNPLELAEGVKKLFNLGMGDKEIAKALGKSAAYIGKLNLLNAAPVDFRKLVGAGGISPTLAIELASKGEINDFMVKHKAGDFTDGKIPGSGEENNGNDAPPKKITKKDLKKADSFKFFKKFLMTADRDKMKNDRKEAFDFMVKMSENKVAIEDFFSFFNQE